MASGAVPTTGPRRWPRPGRLSLRTKLTGSMVLLLTFVCLVIGVASEIALRSFLVGQIDGQLSAASARAHDYANRPPDDSPGPGPNPLNAPGQASGTLSVRFSGDRVLYAGVLTVQGLPQGLSVAQESGLLSIPADRPPMTMALGGLGDYRVQAVSIPGGVVVTGLPLGPMQDTLTTVGWILFGVAAAGVAGAGFLGAFAVRRTLRPLDRVAATAGRVSAMRLDRGQVALSVRVPEIDTDPRTEVGQVGSALNLMLGHIAQALEARHASETRVRRFVADASHELRTPLAAIRGYAELAGRGSALVPPEVAHSMSRIQSESARMTTLVEDLLLLARLDAGRPLDVGVADLTRLTADAVGDAHVAGPGHRWELRLPDGPVPVRGDVQRLHQVLANLLSNARTHTPPGTTVITALSRSHTGAAVLTVTDDGPGIAPELLPSVFERFARGDSSRSRTAGSTGLGMAIASAIVVAHHGTIEVHSRPGHTEFAVYLPVIDSSQRVHSFGTTTPQVGIRP
ncbi:cell wall metabolism sensor histidine kinase WalK [Amycolatopsis sp. BJA-103]|uniref:sensor histidine kinase n=1 Tax=Amycolatopsis sp. BJA-103 TaxID=1911175 RepID=UPI000C76B9E9|nr:HAMP domain-containing sensor histidine kinase [Amycolatopsis sp. BJA-103]AUI57091.1 two-component sensor histidine kinase [Amycolatopsis sp. BJA-103]PNE15368.1 two-component sensor histidine kinase [Amycolatopsis sp. BJA-103]